MNKNGWGLRIELVIIILFLICLLVFVIGLNRLGLLQYDEDLMIDEDLNNFSYEVLENNLEDATKKYIREVYNESFENNVIINYSTLYNNGYIEKLKDEFNNECDGYTEVVKITNAYVYYPYIKCTTYKTDGYGEN